LLQAFDAVSGEGDHSISTNTVEAKAAVFREQVDRQLVQLVFISPIMSTM
jgi:hypothetical protein